METGKAFLVEFVLKQGPIRSLYKTRRTMRLLRGGMEGHGGRVRSIKWALMAGQICVKSTVSEMLEERE